MDFELAISGLCVASSILLYMTGWPLVVKVFRKRSIGDISTFPYIVMLANCCVWITYGLLTKNAVLKLVNTAGFIHQAVYILIFYLYAKNRRTLNKQILGVTLFLILFYTYVTHHMEDDTSTLVNHLGVVGSCFSVAAYAAPLSAMSEVMSKKSTASMNYPLSLANFIVAIEWSVYGAYLHDPFIAGPNFLGLLVSAVQLLLFCLYPTTQTPLLPTTDAKTAIY